MTENKRFNVFDVDIDTTNGFTIIPKGDDVE